MTAFAHDALLYEDTASFVEHLLPFACDGLERGDRVLAVTSPENVRTLRGELGADAPLVDWRDSSSWYASPGGAYRRYARYVEEHADGRRLRVIGEPVWPVDWEAGVREWARYESLLNVAFADTAAWIVCPYDLSALPETVVEHARHTHPTLHARGERLDHDGYVEPDAFWARLDGLAPLAEPAARPRPVRVTADLASLRALVADEARGAGVAAARIPQLVLAVHEVATNALTHGGGDATLRAWRDDRNFVCEVADGGSGLAPPYLGYAIPGLEETTGRGIWLARQLCDLVEIRSDAGGTRVRLHVKLE